MSAAKIIAVSVSETTGVAKENVPEAKVVPIWVSKATHTAVTGTARSACLPLKASTR